MKKFSQHINMVTDCGTFVVACPNIANQHSNDEHDWFLCFDDEPDLTQGRIAMVGLGADSCYELKVTNNPLSDLEKKYALEKVRSGVECQSGKLFIGGLEVIPGDGELLNASKTYLQGGWIDMEKGEYDLTIYTIDTATMSEEQLYSKESTAEIIIQFKPRTKEFIPLEEAPMLFENTDKYLFKVKSPRKLPPLGIKLILIAQTTSFADLSLLYFQEKEHKAYPVPKSYDNYLLSIKDQTNIKDGDEMLAISTEINDGVIYFDVLKKIPPNEGGVWNMIKNVFRDN